MGLDALWGRGAEQPEARLADLIADLQPDQQPRRWDDHVAAYEAVFEPLTNGLATLALDGLGVGPGTRLIDVGAGTGGAALAAARRGASVTAIDASPAMVDRIAERARAEEASVRAAMMDGGALDLADASFDAALSVFGLILFPDPAGALRELRRVLVPGGRVALVTWTEPHRYELVTRLLEAIAEVGSPSPPPATGPAQLRFREEDAFRSLFDAAGFAVDRIDRIEAALRAPSAQALADRLAFAPGIGDLLAGQGDHLPAVKDRFVARLERDQGRGEIALEAIAFIGFGAAREAGAAR
jgi:SAM-dependent methyltransferase